MQYFIFPPYAGVFGIELCPEMRARASAFPDDSFDAVVSAFLFYVFKNASQTPALWELTES